jgi:hypothetical protein
LSAAGFVFVVRNNDNEAEETAYLLLAVLSFETGEARVTVVSFEFPKAINPIFYSE